MTANSTAPRVAAGLRSGAGRRPAPLRRRAALTALAAALLALPLAVRARSCEEWHAEFVSVQGSVELQRSGDSVWRTADQGQTICTGDSVRVNGYGRAAVRLPDKTVMRLDQMSSATFSEPQDDTGIWVKVLRGIIHIISRDPRSLRFDTPYANAGLEGTEFVIEVKDGETDVTVVEGEVKLSNAAGTIAVPSGQRGSARAARAPEAAPVADPFASMRWTPYFAPVLSTELPPADAEPSPAQRNDAGFYAGRAARRIAVGQVSAAEQDIGRAAALAPTDPRPSALRVPLALARGDKETALRDARGAVDASPSSAAALIALSYAQQAQFQLAAAQASLEQAVAAEPGNALAWARLAEIRAARSERDGALAAAERAEQLDSTLAQVQIVLGFSYLEQGDERAVESFARASALDQAAPLPRLGWALALIRQGQLELGRQQLEIAVALDPTNALVRSYMAKIYSAEGRQALADAQLDIAQRLDASEPTPLLYRALSEQRDNAPIPALQALQAATDLNAGRPVYRSRLRLDEELAVRSAGLGQLYRSLDFGQLALLQGWTSTTDEPADYTGHRLLADVYSTLPRHQIARVDELYQAQMLQPLNVTPIPPQLAESNLFILSRLGPGELAHSEFVPLLTENGLSVQGSAIASGNHTHGEDVAVAGLHDKVSYSVGRLDIATDGFRPNNDLEQHVTSAFVQLRPWRDTSVQTELRRSTTDKGDLRLLFDRDNFNPLERQHENVDSMRVGVRHELGGGNMLLASLIYELGDSWTSTGPNFSSTFDTTTRNIDVEHLRSIGRWQIAVGGRYFAQAVTQNTQFSQATSVVDYPIRYSSIYAYANARVTEALNATVGVSGESFSGQGLQKALVNPKLGLEWSFNPNTVLRASIFRELQSNFTSKQSILPSLQPTHVAGFNQFFFGSGSEDSWRKGLALDHRFTEKLHSGVEASRRDLNTPAQVFLPGQPPHFEFVDAREDLLRAYTYWTPTPKLSFAAEYQFEDIDNGGQVSANGYSRLKTRRTPLRVNYFPSARFNTGLTATYIDQNGYFSRAALAPSAPPEYGADSFWYFSWSLGYRLPRHHGAVYLRVDNLLDEQFRFQDTDPEFTQIMPERMLSLRLTLAY